MAHASYVPALPLAATDPPAGWARYRNPLALVTGTVIFAALSTWGAVRSEGFLEADAMTHFLFARFSSREWSYLVNVWGRPLCTGLYALPANLFDDVRQSVLAVRATSLLLAILSGWVGYRVARGQGYRLPALAAVLLFAQPLFYCHSFSELTEIPFALVAILAFWAYQSRQFLVMTLLVSLTPMGRPEGIGLMVMAAAALVLHRRWYYLLLMPVPLLAWSYLGWVSWGMPGDLPWWMWLKKNWPYAPRSAYGSGHWYHFVGLLPVIVSPMMFPFLLVGAWDSLRQGLRLTARRPAGRRDARATAPAPDSPAAPAGGGLLRLRFFADHRARCEVMLAAIPLIVLFVHTVLWTFGLMASNGEPRYLVSVAPFWALVVARGWEWVWDRFRLPAPFLVAAVFASVPIWANRYWQVIPIPFYDNDLMGQAAGRWYRSTPDLERDYPRVMATTPSVYYFLDLSQSDPQRGATWGRDQVAKKLPGTLLFWDPIFGQSNADRSLILGKEQVEAEGWVWVGNVVYGGAWANVYLSPLDAHGRPTDPEKYRPPGDLTPW